MSYPDGTVPTTEQVHPTPVYETIAMGLVALFLWRLRDRFRPGILFAIYLVCAGIERFLVEFLRRNDVVALGLTQPQLLSIVMILVGAIWIAIVASRHGLPARPGDRYPFGPPAQPASA
jgi:phosphatidylglycerol:prolipoprotein diacylglycerol transferase